DMMKRGLEHAMEVRRASEPSRFFDVSYAALLRDPLGTVERIYDHFGYPFTSDAQSAIVSWLCENPQHKHGVHCYRLEDFGLDEAAISQTFKDYIEEFGVEGMV